jgi:hypothetical protein
MTQSISAARKHCDQKKDKAATTDKPSYAWQIVSKKTGKTLRHLKVDGPSINFLGFCWRSVSAFAWAKKNENVIPHFCERSAERTAALYKLQTGDTDVKIVRVLVA